MVIACTISFVVSVKVQLIQYTELISFILFIIIVGFIFIYVFIYFFVLSLLSL